MLGKITFTQDYVNMNSKLPVALGFISVLLLLLLTSLGPVEASRPEPQSSIPAACELFQPDQIDSDDPPTALGLSSKSLDLHRAYQASRDARITEAPVPRELPVGAMKWGGWAVTPEDYSRLNKMAEHLEKNLAKVQRLTDGLGDEEFGTSSWSYVDGFVVAVCGDQRRIEEQLKAALDDVPLATRAALASAADIAANAKALEGLTGVEFQSTVDASCGLTIVGLKKGIGSFDLGSVLIKGTLVEVPWDYLGEPTAASFGKKANKTPLTGGLKIWNSVDGSGSWCTSNMVHNKNGEKWLVTAAHCGFSGNVSGSDGQIGVITNQHWFQGTNSSTHRISKHSLNYFMWGGRHDILAIRLEDYESVSGKHHVDTIIGTSGFPVGDVLLDPTFFYWHTGFEIPGMAVCQSGYSIHDEECGSITTTTYSFLDLGLDPGEPYPAFFHTLRMSFGMDSCEGDSGGTVWAIQSNGHKNVAGIMSRRGPTQFTVTREGQPIPCGNGIYTSISSNLAIGLGAPWGM